MKKLEYTATGGEQDVTSTLLIGKTILSVLKDGIGYTKIVTTTPGEKEVQYINYKGQIVFPVQLTPGESILVLYQDNGNVCFPVTIPDFSLPDAVAGMPYSASFFIGGSKNFSIASISKPTWLIITPSDDMVTFSGTPAISDAGTNSVSFTLSNACGSAPFAQSFQVTIPAASFDTTTFVSGDRSTDVEIANLTGTSTVVVTVTITKYTNVNGGILKVNGATASLGDSYNVTIGSNGKGSLNVEIDGIADNHGTAILAEFTITSVSAGEIGLLKTYLISKVF
jgi:hypothetical protein